MGLLETQSVCSTGPVDINDCDIIEFRTQANYPLWIRQFNKQKAKSFLKRGFDWINGVGYFQRKAVLIQETLNLV